MHITVNGQGYRDYPIEVTVQGYRDYPIEVTVNGVVNNMLAVVDQDEGGMQYQIIIAHVMCNL